MWAIGDAIVLRYVKPEPSGPVAGLPVRVVEDSAARLVMYLAHGTELRWAAVDGRPIRDVSLEERFTSTWGHLPRTWDAGSAVFVFPVGRAHGFWLFFDAAGAFQREWYVNLQVPFRRSAIGVDTRDHTLDLWAAEDGSHRWKDEDELEVAVRLGFHTTENAAAFRAEGERVLAEWPFPTAYESFRPDAAWDVPSLPEGWDAVPSPLAAVPVDELSQSRHERDDAVPSRRR